jgi:hypothetical protein
MKSESRIQNPGRGAAVYALSFPRLARLARLAKNFS